MRIFLDTNVLLSGFFGSGLCAELIEKLIESDHDILIGEPVAQEFVRIAREKFKVPEPVLASALEVMRRQVLVPASAASRDDIPDPDDIPIIACALAGKTDLFVTGDKPLLALKEYETMPLLTPREAWIKLFQH